MLLYGNPNREYLEILQKKTYLDSLLPELTAVPFPDPNTQEAVDEINQLISYTNKAFDEPDLYKRVKLYDTEFGRYITSILLNKGVNRDNLYSLRESIFTDVSPLILKLKYYYGRVRPNQLALLFQMSLYPLKSLTADTPAYPSGHTIMAKVYCEVFGKTYPQYYNQLMDLSKDIADSRMYMGIHYPSDVKFGSYVAELVLNHPEFKLKYKL